MNCTQIDELMLDFVEGELADHEASEVRFHIDRCELCKAKLRDYRGLFGELGAARSLDNRIHRPEASSVAAVPGTHRGVKIIGDFEILDELGRGGMGVVYRAQQISLNRVVALKVLAVGAVQSERAIQRFQHEAQAAARLHHTNIVPVYAQGQADGNFFYAMELIEGRSLSAVLRDRDDALLDGNTDGVGVASRRPAISSQQDATLPITTGPRNSDGATGGSTTLLRTGTLIGLRRGGRRYKRLARLFAEVADGLHHAHEQGIVHRDIKPQNLMLGVDDKLHITDFGLARLASEPALTLTSEIVGTPAYMSPEQISR
ncbi:MAG: protein kinase, partial [Phycisphaerae bacterium]